MMKAIVGRTLPVLMGVLAAGAAPWEGLELDPEDYSVSEIFRDRLLEYSRPGSFERAATDLFSDVEDVPLADLIRRCESVVEAGLAAEARRVLVPHGEYVIQQLEYGGPRLRDWLICMVAIRRVGVSGDSRWIPALERLFEEWTPATGRQRVGRRQIDHVLRNESIDAYRQVVFVGYGLAEIAGQFGRGIRRELDSSALERAARHRLIRELAGKGPWPEEYRSLWTSPDSRVRVAMVRSHFLGDLAPEEYNVYLALLNDPIQEIRSRARVALTAKQNLQLPLVPALLEFLEREDLDDEARRLAVEALRVRGNTVEVGPEGLELCPDPDGTLRVLIEWLNESDHEWRGRSHTLLGFHTGPFARNQDRLVALLLDFLARDDVDDPARLGATSILRQAGYEPVTGPGGCLMAEPVGGDGRPITQDGCAGEAPAQ